jgi:hypothetical protein
MKILVLQLFTPNIIDIAMLSKRNVEEYCNKFHYDYKCYDHSLDPNRHPAWSKILAVLECLNDVKYDWIWWISADAFIANDKVELTSIINKYSKYDIIFTDQKYRCNVNSGSMIIKRSEFSISFFKDVYNNKNVDPFKQACCWEQDSINNLLFNSLNVLKSNPRDIERKYSNNVTIVNNSLFNSVYNPHDTCEHLRTYKDGDFIIHFAGPINIHQINEKLKSVDL